MTVFFSINLHVFATAVLGFFLATRMKGVTQESSEGYFPASNQSSSGHLSAYL